MTVGVPIVYCEDDRT